MMYLIIAVMFALVGSAITILFLNPSVQGRIVFDDDSAYVQLLEDPDELKKHKIVTFYVTRD